MKLHLPVVRFAANFNSLFQHIDAMKNMKKTVVAALFLGFALLSSCNTSIGLYRDAEEGYRWTRDKINESRQHNSGYESAPTY